MSESSPPTSNERGYVGAQRYSGYEIHRGLSIDNHKHLRELEYVLASDYEALRQRFERACAEITRLSGEPASPVETPAAPASKTVAEQQEEYRARIADGMWPDANVEDRLRLLAEIERLTSEREANTNEIRRLYDLVNHWYREASRLREAERCRMASGLSEAEICYGCDCDKSVERVERCMRERGYTVERCSDETAARLQPSCKHDWVGDDRCAYCVLEGHEAVLSECESLLHELLDEDGVDIGFDERLTAYWEKSKAAYAWRSRDLKLIPETFGVWQPIETAPKSKSDAGRDRHYVLVVYPGYKGDEPDPFVLMAYQDSLGWDTGVWRLHATPTHWMPLPSLPGTAPTVTDGGPAEAGHSSEKASGES